MILSLINYFSGVQNRYFRVLLILLRVTFVWNYSLSYLLAQIMNFTLGTFLSYRYPAKNTNVGIFNLVYSIVAGILIVMIVCGIYFVIKKIRRIFLIENNLKKLEENPQPAKMANQNEISAFWTFKSQNTCVSPISRSKTNKSIINKDSTIIMSEVKQSQFEGLVKSVAKNKQSVDLNIK